MRGAHPDAGWASHVCEAFGWWTDQEVAGGPTSSLTGAGAIEALERRAARLVGARFALALPSATVALRAALAACGAGPAGHVLVCAQDWPAAIGAATAVQAPVVRCSPAELLTTQVRCQVAALTPESCTDLLDLAARTGAVLVEDRSRADVRVRRPLVGSAAVYSLGPGKAMDCGEGGLLLTDDEALWRQAVAVTQHPVRQLIAGAQVNAEIDMARIHPLAAVLALWEMRDRG